MYKIEQNAVSRLKKKKGGKFKSFNYTKTKNFNFYSFI